MPLRKSQIRRARDIERAKNILVAIVEQKVETYVCYRQLNLLYCSNSSGLAELKPLFRIAGVDANGTFSVTDELLEQIVAISKQLLVEFSK